MIQPTQQQMLAFVQSQAAHIEPEARMIKYGSIQYPGLVFIDRKASPHADVVLYSSIDSTGTMVDLAEGATDIPLLSLSEAQHTVGIHWKALAYGWSEREIGRAMRLGIDLPSRKTQAAFRLADEEKDRVFLTGDPAKQWDGMINNPNIPVMQADNTWDNLSDRDIFDSVNTLIGNAWTESKQVRIADTLLLPPKKLVALGRQMGDGNLTVLQFIKQHNILTATYGRELMIRTIRQLETAGETGGNPSNRAIAYPRDRQVLRYHIPQELMFSEAQRQALSWVYYGTLVLAGLEIMEPTAMGYLDGI